MLSQDKFMYEQITRAALRELGHEGCDQVNAEWVMLTLDGVVRPDQCEIDVNCTDSRSAHLTFSLSAAESEEWVKDELKRQLLAQLGKG